MINFKCILVKSVFLLFLFSLAMSKEIQQKVIDKDGRFLRMIPDDSHRVVETNSNLTLNCIYVFQDQNENFNHKNLSWRWELPSFLTKYPQLMKTEERCSSKKVERINNTEIS
uniref:Uncharacterized protein n=1 Tax=Daphnia galeata TaxID=27404 RepID=A0A8J2RKI6_9CRUS|nr:unnamed protein product [Daphnia galeata]